MALALEELGFSRFGRDNLFKTPPSEPIDSMTMLPKSKVNKNDFKQAKYSIILKYHKKKYFFILTYN